MSRNFTKFLCLVLSGFFLITFNHKAVSSNTDFLSSPKLPKIQLLNRLPESFQFCWPQSGSYGQIWSAMRVGQRQYYLISVFEESKSVHVIFQHSNNSCLALTPLKSVTNIDSLLKYNIEQDIVLTLALRKYQNLARKMGGAKQLETALKESHLSGSGHDEIYYPLEDILALKELGINIFSSGIIFVVAPEGIYSLDENGEAQLIKNH